MEFNSPTFLCDGQFSGATDQATLNSFEPVVINVNFWEFLKSDGTVDPEDDFPNWDFEKESLDVIAHLNLVFNPYRIFFKYKGINSINDNDLYLEASRPQVFNTLDFLHNQSVNVINNNAINIYVSAKIKGGMARTFFTNQLLVSRGVFRWNNRFTIHHEIGHAFGLLHTHESFFGPVGEFFADCEKVTRDPLDPNFNAITHGDRVVDTKAIPDFTIEHYWEIILEHIAQGYTLAEATSIADFYWTPFKYIENCVYINTNGTDCDGTPYNFDATDIANIMSYAPSDCQSNFTIGQMIRIHEGFSTSCGDELFDAIATDYASLYEPYKGDYYISGPLDPNEINQIAYFQPGFSYTFIECSGQFPEPAPYNTSFPYNANNIIKVVQNTESDYNTIFHPNHSAILIHELNNSLDNNQPQACFNNWKMAPIGGDVIKFNDNVFNANITVTPKDSTAINNPQLIENLDPGLYVIEKVYGDGAIQQDVIIKENQ
ncbi:hypothetical protein [uncultured Planktosalinus sp.]|uniref:hypothetical protein n=1 Tax=uncultured Planktosalinus sp. TaxID=1810935 RepID=UPI0030D75BB4